MSTGWLFSQKNLLNLWLGEVFSQLGSRMYSLALAWWILNHHPDHSGFKLSLLMIFSFLPPILFSKFIGRTIDRLSLKIVFYWANLIGALACFGLLALFFLGHESLVAIYLTGFVLSTVQSFIDPAIQKSVPQVVQQVDQEKTISLLSTTTSFASFAGSFAGAAAVAVLGIRGAVLINALSFALALAFISKVVFNPPALASLDEERKDVPAKRDNDSKPRTFPKQLPQIVNKLLIGFGFFNFFLTPILIVIPVFVSQRLGSSSASLGLLEGFLWSGFLAASILSIAKRSKSKLSWSALKFGTVSFIMMAALLITPALSSNKFLYAIALAFTGLFCGISNIKFISSFHQMVPDDLKGAFFARLGAAASIASPLAFLVSGAMIDTWGLSFFCIFQTVGAMSVAFYFLFLSIEQGRADLSRT